MITVVKVYAPNAGRRSGAPNIYWPHIWWLIQVVKRGVDCNERLLYAAFIIHFIFIWRSRIIEQLSVSSLYCSQKRVYSEN
jgi:hypothetical protein